MGGSFGALCEEATSANTGVSLYQPIMGVQWWPAGDVIHLSIQRMELSLPGDRQGPGIEHRLKEAEAYYQLLEEQVHVRYHAIPVTKCLALSCGWGSYGIM